MTQLESNQLYRDSFVSGYTDGFFSRPATVRRCARRAAKRGYMAGHDAGTRARNYRNTKGNAR